MRRAIRWTLTTTTLAAAALVSAGVSAQLTADGSRLWNQATAGIEGEPETEDLLGVRTVVGDFDGDGFADVACSAMRDGTPDSGSVHVLYGSPTGLTADGSQLWRQDSPGVPGDSDSSDLFGSALAAGDFDGDGFDDLAIGIVGDEGTNFERPGAVLALYGSASGLTAAGAQLFDDSTVGFLEDLAGFGTSLAAGDFDADGFDELAASTPGTWIDGEAGAGVVHVLRGTASGLTADLSVVLHQDLPNVPDDAEAGDAFGYSLAAGFLDDDAAADLVVGVPYEDFDGLEDAGIVQVFYGSVGGLGLAPGEVWHQDVPGVNGTAEAGDRFGWELTVGPVARKGFGALVVGVPYEAISTNADAGAVHVLFAEAGGLTADGSLLYFRGSPSIPPPATGVAEYFGWSLAVADFDRDQRGDLAIGTLQSLPNITSAGEAVVLYGTEEALGGAELWTQNSTGVPGIAQNMEFFSYSLAAGDFAGDSFDDLALGVVFDVVGGVTGGGFNVIPGAALFSDGFESGDTSAWSSTTN